MGTLWEFQHTEGKCSRCSLAGRRYLHMQPDYVFELQTQVHRCRSLALWTTTVISSALGQCYVSPHTECAPKLSRCLLLHQQKSNGEGLLY